MYLMTNLTLLAHLKCGSDSKFLYAGASTHKDHNSLTGHKYARLSFKMEGDGSKFEILLVGTPMYLAINKDHCDRMGRPVMEVGGGESIKCKMEGNYIRIISPRQGYLGYNERENIAVFVEDKIEEEKGSLWLQFKWQGLLSRLLSSIWSKVWPWVFVGAILCALKVFIDASVLWRVIICAIVMLIFCGRVFLMVENTGGARPVYARHVGPGGAQLQRGAATGSGGFIFAPLGNYEDPQPPPINIPNSNKRK